MAHCENARVRSPHTPPKTTADSAKPLPAAPSLLLDIIRFSAAVVVAIGHVSQPFFGNGLPEMTSYATAAVAVFFALSGFVIRYITLARYSEIRRYTIDRAARIYSVVLPALALTILLDAASRHLNQQYYLRHWGQFSQHAAMRLGLNVTFLAESWFRDYAPLSNNPFWSLSYECVYYAAYGIAFYLAGKKRLLGLAIVFLLVGPSIFLLFPVWLLGCVTYDIYIAGRFNARNAMRFLALSAWILAIDAIRWYESTHTPKLVHYMVRVFIVQGYVAILATLLMLFGAWRLKNVAVNEKHWMVRTIRWFANATFVLYLIHYPLLVLAVAAMPSLLHRGIAKLVVVAVIVLLAAPVAGLSDRLKNAMRRIFSQAWPPAAAKKEIVL